tara:strand:+ start:1095 stop:1280 length:186 start_codon:yes stop_codon:yes gene_type:complete
MAKSIDEQVRKKFDKIESSKRKARDEAICDCFKYIQKLPEEQRDKYVFEFDCVVARDYRKS